MKLKPLPILSVVVLLAGCTTNSNSPAVPTTRTGIITAKGKPLTLEGKSTPTVGDVAPDFTAVANDMTEKKLSDFRGKTVILSTVPSIDTPVCDHETRSFNEKAAGLGGNTVVPTVSMDLPFAQKRWCAAAGVDRVITLSDSKLHDVAHKYGLRIHENGLLARSVTVINPSGTIVYQQIVPDVATEPNYEAALAAANSAR